MATTIEKIRRARKEGYSEAEIAEFLGRSDPRVAEAVSQGYSLNDIAAFLEGQRKQAKPPVKSGYEYDPMATGQPTPEEMAGRDKNQEEMRRFASAAIRNLPGSVANLIGDVAGAVTSPVQTVQTMADIGAGTLQNLLPESVVQAIGEDPRSREVARGVGQFYQQRYGSPGAIAQTVSQDPAGALADVSSLLYGGGAALRGTAGATRAATGGRVTLPSVQAAGESLRAAGTAVDPLLATARGTTAAAGAVGRNVVAPVLGATTGAGAEPIRQAYTAGREGGPRAEQFRANISGTANQAEILNAARQNLATIRDQRNQAYRSGMMDVTNDKTVLTFDGIDDALKKAESRTRFKGKVKDKEAANALQQAKKLVNEWKKAEPAEYHTPEGIDALKQSIGAILEGLKPNTNPYSTVNQVYNAVKSEISKQAPTYAETMKGYTEASETIREIEKALSLGNKSSADTAMRKLQSLMRDNVNTNFGQRVRLGQTLEEQGGLLMMPGLAGQSLQSAVPRGIQGATAIPGAGLSYLVGGVPAATISAAASSPRLMGEMAYGTGLIGRGIDATRRRMPALLDPELYNLLYQTERTTQ